MIKRVLFILSIFICSTNLSIAQDTAYRSINHFLPLMEMNFILPKGYFAQKNDFYFNCDAFLSVPIHYTILKKNRNVLIGIYFGGPIIHNDSNYIAGVKMKADTINHRIIYLPHEFVKKNNNADRGVEYSRNCQIPIYLIDVHNKTKVATKYEFMKGTKILKRYNHNKILSISKDGIGHVELDYLYTDAVTEKEIEKEIRETSKMLRFND
jgi:hypothetical protein